MQRKEREHATACDAPSSSLARLSVCEQGLHPPAVPAWACCRLAGAHMLEQMHVELDRPCALKLFFGWRKRFAAHRASLSLIALSNSLEALFVEFMPTGELCLDAFAERVEANRAFFAEAGPLRVDRIFMVGGRLERVGSLQYRHDFVLFKVLWLRQPRISDRKKKPRKRF